MTQSTYDPRDTEEAFRKAEAQNGPSPDSFEGIEKGVPVFHPVDDYTTFRAEWAEIGSAFVLHFFISDEMRHLSTLTRYWEQDFPTALSDTAERYFEATAPRIIASYTPELESWFMRANGFTPLDPQEFLRGFFDELDRALDAV
jgi:hypothetical protein